MNEKLNILSSWFHHPLARYGPLMEGFKASLFLSAETTRGAGSVSHKYSNRTESSTSSKVSLQAERRLDTFHCCSESSTKACVERKMAIWNSIVSLSRPWHCLKTAFVTDSSRGSRCRIDLFDSKRKEVRILYYFVWVASSQRHLWRNAAGCLRKTPILGVASVRYRPIARTSESFD